MTEWFFVKRSKGIRQFFVRFLSLSRFDWLGEETAKMDFFGSFFRILFVKQRKCLKLVLDKSVLVVAITKIPLETFSPFSLSETSPSIFLFTYR